MSQTREKQYFFFEKIGRVGDLIKIEKKEETGSLQKKQNKKKTNYSLKKKSNSPETII